MRTQGEKLLEKINRASPSYRPSRLETTRYECLRDPHVCLHEPYTIPKPPPAIVNHCTPQAEGRSIMTSVKTRRAAQDHGQTPAEVTMYPWYWT